MDYIRQAVERAKMPNAREGQQPLPHANPTVASPRNEVLLNNIYLESKRIISHDVTDSRSKSFDMLRTQVLQSMDTNSWQFLGITSPTPDCGKSVVAINLALSAGRQPDRSVLLVDADLQKPQVASDLGLQCKHGLVSVLEGNATLSQALIPIRIRNSRLLVLPCERSVLHSSESMASRAMSALLNEIKRNFKTWTVIFDLPPILLSDDVISILPQIDCVLFVAAAGKTTPSEIKDCNKYLESTQVVRIVLNKATEETPAYYYSSSRYGYASTPQAKTNSPRGNKAAGVGQSAKSSLQRLLDQVKRF
jgi:protein-tyrosine kinase